MGDREEGNKGVRKQGSGGQSSGGGAGELGKQGSGWSRKTNEWKKRGLGNRGAVKVPEKECRGRVNSKNECREITGGENKCVCVCVCV